MYDADTWFKATFLHLPVPASPEIAMGVLPKRHDLGPFLYVPGMLGIRCIHLFKEIKSHNNPRKHVLLLSPPHRLETETREVK